jgi:hypothetical protein
MQNNTAISINNNVAYLTEKLSGGTSTSSTRNKELDEAVKRSEGMKSVEVVNKEYGNIKNGSVEYRRLVKNLKK